MRQIIGMDIGGTYIRTGLGDRHGTVCHFQKVRQEEVLTGNVFSSLLGYIHRFIERFCPSDTASAVCIGIPGTVDPRAGKILQAPNLSGMDGLALAAPLQEALGIPVLLVKDVWTALWYDLRREGMDSGGIVLGCYFGTGIGNCVMLDGRPLAGKNFAACELGHIPFGRDKRPCGCGNQGCIETVSGGKRLRELCQTVFSGVPVSDIFVRHRDHALLKDFVEDMAVAAATEINIFDPDTVILGGGVPNMLCFPKEELRRLILAHTRKPLPAQNLSLFFVPDEDEKGVVGAVRYAFEVLDRTGPASLIQ